RLQPDVCSVRSRGVVHFNAAVAQQNQSAKLLTSAMRVQFLPAAKIWGRMCCRSEPVLQTSCCECDSHRLHFLPVVQQTELQPAKLRTLAHIQAGRLLFMEGRQI